MTRWPLLVLLALPWALACGSSGEPEHGIASASPGPALAVERFLQAANANDLDAMLQLFGTSERTIREIDGRSKAEQRMYVLASLLRHDDYVILGQEAVPGRIREAAEVEVELHQGNRRTVVPHIVVRRQTGGWIVERVEIERLTDSG